MRRMWHTIATIMLTALFVGGGAWGKADSGNHGKVQCRASQEVCKKTAKKKQVKKGKKAPVRVNKPVVPPKDQEQSLSPSEGPIRGQSQLSAKQEAMRDAFNICIRYSTKEDPVLGVKKYIFDEQRALEEGGGWRRLMSAIRGSPEHHAHEVCLARAYALMGFKNQSEINEESGKALLPILSPHVDVAEDEIPKGRRLARSWTKEYIEELADDLHRTFASNDGSPPVRLRVTSMIRSFEDQQGEVRKGRSPADCRYEFLCSTHTTGSALDIGFKDIRRDVRAWLQERLHADQRKELIYFIVEGSHFHVFVLPPEYIGEER